MKSVMRTVLLGGLAMLVLNGVATASASAAACKVNKGSGKFQLCIEGQESSEAGLTLGLKKATTMTMYAEPETEKESITCKQFSGAARLQKTKGIEGTALTNLGLTGKECQMMPAACIAHVVYFGFNEAEGLFIPQSENIRLGQSTGFLMAKTNVTGEECALVGEYRFDEGSHEGCKISEREHESSEHVLICNHELRWVGKEWRIKFEDVMTLATPNAGKKFSVIED